MAFEKNNWKSGDIISSEKLNAMEDGIAEGLSTVDWAEVTNKPDTFSPTIGTTATTAKAGNYVPTYAEITGKPTTFEPSAHKHTIANITGLQTLLDDLEARLSALETPSE